MIRRVILMLTVAAIMAAVMATSALPANADTLTCAVKSTLKCVVH
jgi:hypothetical protein